jgi:hypothetical protein
MASDCVSVSLSNGNVTIWNAYRATVVASIKLGSVLKCTLVVHIDLVTCGLSAKRLR